MLNDQEFRLEADRALEGAQRALMPLADEHDIELELQNGVLQIAFEEPAPTRFIVSPNAPVRQIWVSAMGRGYKLPWSPERSAFVLENEPLDALLTRLIREFLKIS